MRICAASRHGARKRRCPICESRKSWISPRRHGSHPAPTGALTAIICINVLHIAPWSVSENLLSGAARLLRPGGRLFVYGPFMRDGVHTAPSNASFDESLRAKNPEWGVRDLAELSALAARHGLAAIRGGTDACQ